MDFKKAAELLSLCKEYDKPISQIMVICCGSIEFTRPLTASRWSY